MRLVNSWSLALIAIGVAAACADPSSIVASKIPTEPLLAPGGGKAGSFVSLTGGIETAAPQKVGATITEGGWRLSGQSPFVASIQLATTHAAGIADCVAEDYGFEGNDDIKTELLQLLIAAEQTLTVFQASSTGPIIVGWNSSNLLIKVRQVTTSQVGGVYTYTGGNVYVLRSNGLKGKLQVKHDMTCPNLDPIVLTFPA